MKLISELFSLQGRLTLLKCVIGHIFIHANLLQHRLQIHYPKIVIATQITSNYFVSI